MGRAQAERIVEKRLGEDREELGLVRGAVGVEEDTPALLDRPYEDLTGKDVACALDSILDVICDFPFVSDADRAHALALWLLAPARCLIDGPTPLTAVTAVTRGRTTVQEVAGWKLVDAAGCRGLRIGDAVVSEKHCNFLINEDQASAEDIERLGETVRARVLATSGIRLEWEIVRLGEPLPGHVTGEALADKQVAA